MAFIFEKFKFITELLILESVFVYPLKKKEHFILRALSSVLVLYLAAFLWPTEWSGWINALKYPLFFIMSLGAVKFCFETSIWEAIFFGVASYTIQHIGFQMISFMTYGFPNLLGNISYYSVQRMTLEVLFDLPFIIYFFHWSRKRGSFKVNNRSLLLVSWVVIMMAIFLNYARILNSASFSRISNFICIIYSLISCFFALVILFDLHEKSSLRQEISIIEQLWHQKKEQYTLSAQNIELINMKSHNLKHQIAAIRLKLSDKEIDQMIGEVEEAVNIYDSSLKTDNEALDIILTEKSLYCEKHDIKLTCMVDGASFNFIKTVDLYMIFGNLLDNAIEAVSQLDDPDKKIIGITGVRKGNILHVHLENYFNQQLHFEDGLPLTTKNNQDFHGYGLKSVRLLLDKYSGDLSVHTSDDLFYLNLMIPISYKAFLMYGLSINWPITPANYA